MVGAWLAAVGATTLGCAGAADDTASSEGHLDSVPTAERFAFNPRGEREGNADLLNAYWFAQLAQLANKTDVQLQQALSTWGVDIAELEAWQADVSRVYYLRTPRVAFLVFRGTRFVATVEGVKEVLADFHATQTPFGVGHAHSGFAKIVRAAWPTLAPYLRARHGGGQDDVPLYIVGHSMGASAAGLALACALGAEAGYPTVPVAGLYTFGMPRTVNPTLAEWIGGHAREQGTTISRFVYGWDVPSQFPTRTLGPYDYSHLSQNGDENAFLDYIDRKGELFLGYFDEPQRMSDVDAVVHNHDPATYAKSILDLARARRLVR